MRDLMIDWISNLSLTDIIYTIISLIILITGGYYKIKSNISEGISSFIRDAAEYENLTGPQKMDMVISWTKNFIPRAFKVMFSEEVLRKMAQNVYDDMKTFSKNYVKEKTGLSITKIEKLVEVIDDPQYKNKATDDKQE